MTRRWWIYLLVTLWAGLADCRAAATNDLFFQGVTAARAGRFGVAAKAFSELSRRQPAAGTLVNLGIAEWQLGHAGPAILAWERARWLNPFETRAADNLQFARAVVQLQPPSLRWFETVSTWLPANAWVWLAGFSLWLAVGSLVLPRILRSRKAGWHHMLAALGFCLFLAGLTASLGVVTRTDIGFVLKPNVPLLLTPTKTGEVLQTLNGGEAARRLRTRGDYDLVRTPDGTGWIERKQFGLLGAEDPIRTEP